MLEAFCFCQKMLNDILLLEFESIIRNVVSGLGRGEISDCLMCRRSLAKILHLADHLTCSKCYFEWVACFLAIQFFSVVFACIINPVYFVLVAMTIAYYCAFLSQQSSELAWGACPNLRHRCGPSLHWRHQLHALRTGSPLHWRCASCLLQRFVSKCHVIARPFVRCYARNIDF